MSNDEAIWGADLDQTFTRIKYYLMHRFRFASASHLLQPLDTHLHVPVYVLEPDEIARNKLFRLYTYEGNLPNQAELLIPHWKDYYLIVFIRRVGVRQ